jgi:hypothetical protein
VVSEEPRKLNSEHGFVDDFARQCFVLSAFLNNSQFNGVKFREKDASVVKDRNWKQNCALILKLRHYEFQKIY